MSFSADVKGELARLSPAKKCCMLAEIAGFLRASGSVRITGGSFAIVATTESAAVAMRSSFFMVLLALCVLLKYRYSAYAPQGRGPFG